MDVVVVEGVDPAGMPLAATAKTLFTMSRAASNPLYLKIASTVPSFSVENGYSRPMCFSGTTRNSFSAGILKPAPLRHDARGAGNGLGVRCPSASQ
jgi:hypothetical protein